MRGVEVVVLHLAEGDGLLKRDGVLAEVGVRGLQGSSGRHAVCRAPGRRTKAMAPKKTWQPADDLSHYQFPSRRMNVRVIVGLHPAGCSPRPQAHAPAHRHQSPCPAPGGPPDRTAAPCSAGEQSSQS